MLVFLGVPSAFPSSRVGRGGGGIDTFSSGFGLAAQAKEMQRFFSKAWTAGIWFRWATPAVGPARGTNPTLGNRGLGELVRAGVVMPVPQVEAKLVLLVIERRR